MLNIISIILSMIFLVACLLKSCTKIYFTCLVRSLPNQNSSVRSFGLVVFLQTVNIVLMRQVSQPVTCNFDLCNRPVSALCVRSDLHHVVSICMQGEVYVSFIGCVQNACGVSLFPVQDLKKKPYFNEWGTPDLVITCQKEKIKPYWLCSHLLMPR